MGVSATSSTVIPGAPAPEAPNDRIGRFAPGPGIHRKTAAGGKMDPGHEARDDRRAFGELSVPNQAGATA